MKKERRRLRSDRYNGSRKILEVEEDAFVVALEEAFARLPSLDAVFQPLNVEAVMWEPKFINAFEGLKKKYRNDLLASSYCLTIKEGLVEKYMPDFVHDRYQSTCESIVKILKCGDKYTKLSAADLAVILCLQLGSGGASADICSALKSVLIYNIKNRGQCSLVRITCCNCLAMIFFLGSEDMTEMRTVMKFFEFIFSASYLRRDGSVPKFSSSESEVHAAAVRGWTLLFTLMSPTDAYSMLNEKTSFSPSISQLCELLTTPNIPLRISTGKALATIYESGRECDGEFGQSYVPDILLKLKQLTTDSNKNRSRHVRKMQKNALINVINYIQNSDVPQTTIEFATEKLEIKSWDKRCHYDSISDMFGSHMKTQLAENEFLREIFDLGDIIQFIEVKVKKQTKKQKTLKNAAVDKARTVSRRRDWQRRQYDSY